MKTLTEFKIRVGPREFGHNQLDEAQQVLVKALAEKTMVRGGFVKVRLANILKEEMRFTARHTGGQTQEEIDYLLNGTEIAFGDEEKVVPEDLADDPSGRLMTQQIREVSG